MLRSTRLTTNRSAVIRSRPARDRRAHRVMCMLSVAIFCVLSEFAGAPIASATNTPSQLALTAIGQPGAYFDVTITAGATISLQVGRSNPGASTVTAHSYAGSVFTIVNGGFGVAGRETPPTGATEWVHYADETFSLGAGATDTKTFSVTVPAGTPPGQYMSSIVVESDAASAGANQVTLDHVLRQAVAIAIRVPGTLEPHFALSDARHTTVGGRSVVEVSLRNDGNQRLKPTGTMTVTDATNTVVSDAPVAMGSVYAEMDTTVAVTLNGLLAPGRYTVSLALMDLSTGVTATITDNPITVVDPPGSRQSPSEQLPAIVQASLGYPGASTIVLAIATVSAIMLVLATVLLVRRRARNKRAATTVL
jgi:hypothetical protein